jgi:hypothetical protein
MEKEATQNPERSIAFVNAEPLSEDDLSAIAGGKLKLTSISGTATGSSAGGGSAGGTVTTTFDNS